MKLSGHKTRSVFDRHNIVSDGDLRSAAVRLKDVMKPERSRHKSRSGGQVPAGSSGTKVLRDLGCP
jgi:hypothetical protein